MGIANIVFGSIFVGTLLFAASALVYSYRHVPTHKAGEYGIALPWVGNEVVIEQVRCGWMDLTGDSWMTTNKVSHAPYIYLKLGECQGSGTLYVHFKNEQGQYTGNPVTLVYRNGQFDAIDRKYYKATEKKAQVYAYPPFENTQLISDDDQFLRHSIDDRQKHWLVEVSYIPAGKNDRTTLGYTTIAKELHHEN